MLSYNFIKVESSIFEIIQIKEKICLFSRTMYLVYSRQFVGDTHFTAQNNFTEGKFEKMIINRVLNKKTLFDFFANKLSQLVQNISHHLGQLCTT